MKAAPVNVVAPFVRGRAIPLDIDDELCELGYSAFGA